MATNILLRRDELKRSPRTAWNRLMRAGLACLAACFCSAPLAAQTNGIFADFTTSLGNFTCQLDYTNAPRAVANFVGLATGTRAWLNETNGQVWTNAFYDGLTFHRTITNFMIQTGSRNAEGTDGIGFVLLDEISSLKHDGPGVLAMANMGPNSSAAQFYITVTNTSWLDGSYTIFGRIVSGQSVVNTIDLVPTDTNNKPVTNVVLQHVAIRRVGAAAQAFDINAQNLPLVSGARLTVSRDATNLNLAFTNNLNTDYRFRSSTNLTAWTAVPLGINVIAASNQVLVAPIAGPRKFFSVVQVKYPGPTWAPLSILNRKLTLTITNGLQGTATYTFDNNGTGTYLYSDYPLSGAVSTYTYNQAAYRASVQPLFHDAGHALVTQLNFSSATAGRFSGTFYYLDPTYYVFFNYPMSGTFTLTSP